MRWRGVMAVWTGVIVYCVWCLLLIAAGPGLQYDEALLVAGGAHMAEGSGELPLPHDPDTWICPRQHCVPLMNVRYVGPIKDYLVLPLFLAFGINVASIRLVAMLLGAIGIYGITKLVCDQAGLRIGLSLGVLLGCSATYVGITVLDNGAVSPMMAALGLLCLAINRYIKLPGWSSAFLIGCSLGFGVWARANFLLFAGALAVSILWVFSKRLLRLPLQHWLALTFGALLAGFPFLLYQVRSGAGTWQGLEMFSTTQGLWERAGKRALQFVELLLSDREHRVIWHGPFLPEWQLWYAAIVLVAGIAASLLQQRQRSELARVTAITLLILSALLFVTRLEISEHHLVALLPLALCAAVLGASRSPKLQWFWRSAGVAYLAISVYWNSAAVLGTKKTGGTLDWSNSIDGVAQVLSRDYSTRETTILDWGLQDNLFVLTGGKLRTREAVFSNVSSSQELRQYWKDAVRGGGVFLLNAAGNRHFAEPTNVFLETLASYRPTMRRAQFHQQNGEGYADLVEIAPNTLTEPEQRSVHAITLLLNDPSAVKNISGFHAIEEGSWRWSERKFSVQLDAPLTRAGAPLELMLQGFLPEVALQHAGGEITLSASLNGHPLPSTLFQRAGEITYIAPLGSGLLTGEKVTIEFQVDHYIPATAADPRDLGIIVKSVKLQP